MSAECSISQNYGLQKAGFSGSRDCGLFASDGQLVVCAWCGQVMVEVEGRVSHGCCGACRERYFKNGRDRNGESVR